MSGDLPSWAYIAAESIKHEEVFRAKSYWDHKQWSVGYGMRCAGAGVVVSEPVAYAQMLEHVFGVGAWLDGLLPAEVLVDHRKGALISLIYNIGRGAFLKSTMLRWLAAGNIEKAGREFARWCYVESVPSDGLKDRRERELSIFKGEG